MLLEKFRALSDAEVEKIHAASVEILETIGIKVFSDKILDMLEQGGAVVDKSTKVVKFSEKQIEECIKSVPTEFTLYDRAGKESLVIGDRVPKLAAGHNAVFMSDYKTNERRPGTVRDVEEFAILCEHLTDIDMVGVPLSPQDVPMRGTLLHAVRALYENTVKPLFFSTDLYAANHAIMDMMRVTAKNEDPARYPNAVSQLSPTSPLYWEGEVVEAVVDTAEQGIPLAILPEPMSGVTSPYSVAGLLTMHNTEALSGIIIAQIAAKGAPMMYASSWTTYDMKYSNAVIGSAETTLLRTAGCQMADYYKIPSHTTAPNTDVNGHDEQMAYEKVLSTLFSVAAGNDIVMNAGMFSCGLSISLEQLILDDDMNGLVRRLAKGIEVSDATIDLESIKRVGHCGMYFEEDLTIRNLRSDEFYCYKCANMGMYDSWFAAGCPSVTDKAHEQVQEYLAKGGADPLEKSIQDKLDSIVSDYEK